MKYQKLFRYLGKVILGTILSLPSVCQNNLKFEYLTQEDGLSQIANKCLFRDKIGWLWVGTQDGLNKYDGTKVTIYRNETNTPNSLLSADIKCLTEGQQAGILWVGTNKGLNRFNTLTQQFEAFVHSPNDPNTLSANFVSSLLVDHTGLLWIGTSDGLNVLDERTGKIRRYLHQANQPNSISDKQIRCLIEDRRGNIWIGTENGLTHFNRKSGRFTRYNHQPTNANSLSANKIQCLAEDALGNLWIGTAINIDFNRFEALSYARKGIRINYSPERGGLNRFDTQIGQFTRYTHNPANPNSPSSDDVQGIIDDGKGTLWITTAKGLTLFHSQTGQFTQYHPIPSNPHSLRSDDLESIIKDQEGTIWIGGREVAKHRPQTTFFSHYFANPLDRNGLSENHVWPILEDSEGILWVGTLSKGGLNRFDRSKNQWTHYRHNRKDPHSLGNDDVFHLFEGRNNMLWMTTGNGLNGLDKKTGRFTHYVHDEKDPHSLGANTSASQVMEDSKGIVWVGTRGSGLNRMIGSTGKFQFFTHDPNDPYSISGNNVCCLLEDKAGKIWVGMWGAGLCCYDPKTNRFKRYPPDPKGIKGLLSKSIYCIKEDRNGNIWVGGSQGMDVLNPATGAIRHYGEKEGLPNHVVYGIEEDKQGKLWTSTNQGLARLDPKTNRFAYFDKSDGLQSLEFNGFSSGKSKRTGELFFGGMNGFNAFHPDSIRESTFKPMVLINTLRRFNADKASGLPTEEMLTGRKSIMLSYQDNMLSFEFLSLSLEKPLKNQYAYQLKGFSDQWYQLSTKREVTFAGLAPGNYTLLVKGSNGNGFWNDTPTQLQIAILPPWWRTLWAYILYGLLILSTLVAFIYYRSAALRRENRILEEKIGLRTNQLEHKSQELEKSLDNLKATQAQLIQKEKLASLGELTAGIAHEIQNPLNFVNNFSELSVELIGELKSPLTPDGGIREGEKVDMELLADVVQNLEKINLHGKRASSIVKGMLEHSRQSTGERALTDINQLADEYLRLAYHGLRSKNQDFNCDLITDFDPNPSKIEVIPQDIGRVLLNLLNNAFYAVKGVVNPTISLSTEISNNQIIIKVKDNGVGMTEATKAKVFQPFFTTKPTGEGTGLGLSLAYDIVTKGHGGTMEVESVEGEGTTFIVKLPIQNS